MTQITDSYTHATIETNGVRLHVVQAGPEDGPLALVLHGFPDFWYGWKAQIDALAAAGYRVWAPDQRGYNLSEKPKDVSAYHLDQLSADIVGLIDAAGRQKAVILAHDWGANVAWWTAIFHSERVEKLAIVNVGHPLAFRQTLKLNPEQKKRSWYIGFFQIRVIPEFFLSQMGYRGVWNAMSGSAVPGTFTEEDHRQYVSAWSQPHALHSMINWYRANTDLPPLTSREQWRVHVPTLIIWGQQDKFLVSDLAQASADLCDNAQVVPIPDGTHWVAHEQPARVSGLALDFFKG